MYPAGKSLWEAGWLFEAHNLRSHALSEGLSTNLEENIKIVPLLLAACEINTEKVRIFYLNHN